MDKIGVITHLYLASTLIVIIIIAISYYTACEIRARVINRRKYTPEPERTPGSVDDKNDSKNKIHVVTKTPSVIPPPQPAPRNRVHAIGEGSNRWAERKQNDRNYSSYPQKKKDNAHLSR